MKEKWKNVSFSKWYEVSNKGRIRSWKKFNQHGKYKREKPKILKLQTNQHGYKRITLPFNNNAGKKTFAIHRLVAKAFISNPDDKPCINHKDGDKKNNHVDNLEWVTYKENAVHASKNNLLNPLTGKEHGRTRKIGQYTLKGDLVNIFNSQREAQKETGIRQSSISTCCSGKYDTAGGYQWRFLDELNNTEKIPKTKPPIQKTSEAKFKKVKQYDLNGNFIKKYESIKQACKETNTNKSGISACCKGNRNTSNGYKWEYV